jgi:hypothetical protein
MQSQWHNCPTINGVQQQDGRSFKANAVQFSHKKNGSTLAMDIAAAYPATAAVAQWKRTFAFSQQPQQLKITEDYTLTEWKAPFKNHFMTCLQVDTSTPGKIAFNAGGNRSIFLSYDPALFSVETEQQPINDGRLSPVWGSSVTRVSLVAKRQQLKGSHNFLFQLK